MIPETPITPETISGPAGETNSGNSGKSLDTGDSVVAQNPDPLATPGLLRFLLGKSASDTLRAAGSYFILQACQSPRPEDAGRFVLLALPTDKATCDAAARIAKGTHRATRIKNATP